MRWMLYVGGYTRAGRAGLYQLTMDAETGTLDIAAAYPGTDPSFLVLSHSGETLYAVQEYPLGRETVGRVQAWRVLPGGGLDFINQRETGGGFPCHLAVDGDDRFLYCANYQDGSAPVFALEPDGALGGQTAFLRHLGQGPDRDRQECAHVHCVRFTPDGRFIAVCDLGLDRVSLLPFDPNLGWGTEAAFINCPPGAGARHIAFSPCGRFAYLVCEMGGLVEVYRYAAGRLEWLQQAATLPENFTGENTAAALKLSPNGRQLTVSNRGHDSLCTFDVGEDGRLSNRRFVPSGGSCPRDFAYTADGRLLLAANQEGGGLRVFAVSAQGDLTPTGQGADLPHPSCVLLADKPLTSA